MRSLSMWMLDHLPKSSLVPLRFASARIKGKLEPELEYLQDLLPTCRLAIDIGANDGNYCYLLSRFAREVKAFEPQPALCARLRAWNNSRVEVFNIGLSDQAGSLSLYVPRDKSGRAIAPQASFRPLPNSLMYEVPVRRLDDFNFKDVDFIKIDVEGHETEVFRGAVETIRQNNPILLIEIEQRHLNRPIVDVLNEVVGFGYRGYFLANRQLIDISAFSFKTHQAPYLKEIENSVIIEKGYVNNFFFIPES